MSPVTNSYYISGGGEMADNTVTLVLDGDVPLQEFSKAIVGFSELVKALSVEAGGGLDWVMQDLQVSSALVSALAIGDEPKIEAVITSYETVAQALEEDIEIPYSEKVRVAAKKIVSIEDYRIKAVRFETAKREATVRISPINEGDVPMVSAVPSQSESVASKLGVREVNPAYGAIQGRIQTLTSRGRLRFTLYDLLYDKAVSCYLSEEKLEMIRGLWGSVAIVEGFVSRDPITGRLLSIRQVSGITPVKEPESPFDYQQALSIAPSMTGLSPEEAIRRIRDAQ